MRELADHPLDVTASERAEDLAEAADDLIDAAQYLQEALEAGEGIYESKWLGAVMRAHEMLLTEMERYGPRGQSASEPPSSGEAVTTESEAP